MAEKGKVTSGIVKYLRKNIQEGNWKVGEQIPSENELCATLGVSRVSVRNALQQMSALGILESRHGKGTFLLSDDLSVFGDRKDADAARIGNAHVTEMKRVLEFRALLEPSVCARVAEKATPELIERLSLLLEKMQQSIGKSREVVEADMRFHLEICQVIDNPFLSRVMAEVLQKKEDTYHRLNMAVGYYGGIYYHSLILEALKKHDPKRAKTVMREHIERSIDDLSLEEENGQP